VPAAVPTAIAGAEKPMVALAMINGTTRESRTLMIDQCVPCSIQTP
jgi:hypothetical protein